MQSYCELFLMKAVAFDWMQVFRFEDKQLNNSSFNYLLKARRECNSERCQRQRWREGPENCVILKSSVTIWLLFIKTANRNMRKFFVDKSLHIVLLF